MVGQIDGYLFTRQESVCVCVCVYRCKSGWTDGTMDCWVARDGWMGVCTGAGWMDGQISERIIDCFYGWVMAGCSVGGLDGQIPDG